MFNLKRMAVVAWDGLDDMLPALKHAISKDRDADVLKRAYGPRPQLLLIGIGVACVLLGVVFARYGPYLPFKDYVSWPAVFLGLSLAALMRRFFFGVTHSKSEGGAEQFTLLAASLIPAVGISLLGIAIFGDAGSTVAYGHDPSTTLSHIALLLTGLLAVAAALTISVASLCYSRSWHTALLDLAIRLLVFRITIWVTTLVFIEVGWLGQVVGLMVAGIFDITIPEWVPVLVDELTYATILSLVFLALIGGTWTACRDSYRDLLATGHVDILKRLESMLKDKPKKRKSSSKKTAADATDQADKSEK